MKANYNTFKELWNETASIKCLIFSLIILMIDCFSHQIIFGLLFYICIWVSIDVLVWYQGMRAFSIGCDNTLSYKREYCGTDGIIKEEKFSIDIDKKFQLIYRIIQFTLQFYGTAFLWHHWGFYCAGINIILWWTGCYDLIYYWISGEKIDFKEHIYWLENWSIYLFFKKPLYGKRFFYVSIFFIIVCFIFSILIKKLGL